MNVLMQITSIAKEENQKITHKSPIGKLPIEDINLLPQNHINLFQPLFSFFLHISHYI